MLFAIHSPHVLYTSASSLIMDSDIESDTLDELGDHVDKMTVSRIFVSECRVIDQFNRYREQANLLSLETPTHQTTLRLENMSRINWHFGMCLLNGGLKCRKCLDLLIDYLNQE